MNRSRRLGILGGMFDPIHVGHLDTASAAERVLHLTDILLIPARIPPHRPQPLASSYHRFAMVSMALTGRRGWRASDLELSRPTPSYTADTLRYFLSLGYFPTELVFITGADAFLEIATWKEYPALLDLAHFAVVTRPGVRLDEVPSRLPALRLRMRAADGSLVQLPAPRKTAEDSRPRTRLDGKDGAEAGVRDTSDARTLIFLIEAATADVSSTAVREACLHHRSTDGMLTASVRQHIDQHGLYEEASPAATGVLNSARAAAGRLHGQD
jgi:nicotinate-nucleotide adenylyltransferase